MAPQIVNWEWPGWRNLWPGTCEWWASGSWSLFKTLQEVLVWKFESCCAFCKDCAGGSIQTKRGTFDLGRAKHETCRKAEAASKTALDTCATEMARLESAKESAFARWGLKQKCWTMDRLNVAKYDRFFSMSLPCSFPHVCGTISAAIFFLPGGGWAHSALTHGTQLRAWEWRVLHQVCWKVDEPLQAWGREEQGCTGGMRNSFLSACQPGWVLRILGIEVDCSEATMWCSARHHGCRGLRDSWCLPESLQGLCQVQCASNYLLPGWLGFCEISRTWSQARVEVSAAYAVPTQGLHDWLCR